MTEAPYTLLLGDCLERMGEIEAGSVDLILTDLPYGSTRSAWDAAIPFAPLWEAYERVLGRGGCVVLTAAQPFASSLVVSNPKWYRYEWIWEKPQGTGHLNAKKQPLRSHEQILVFAPTPPPYYPQLTKGKPYRAAMCGKDTSSVYDARHNLSLHRDNPEGDRYPKTVLRFSQERGGLHPNQKPVALMEYLIRTYTNEGATVLDSCCGSGTTGVGCVNTNRRFIGIERDPDYFKIAQERIQKAALTGGLFAKEFTP